MEGQTLSEKSEKMIEAILESYKEYPVTVRMDTENIVNKNVLIQVLEKLPVEETDIRPDVLITEKNSY